MFEMWVQKGLISPFLVSKMIKMATMWQTGCSREAHFGCENKHPHTCVAVLLLNRLRLSSLMFWPAYELITCCIRKKTLKLDYLCVWLYGCFALETPVLVVDTPARKGSVPLATDKGSSLQYYESWRESESWNSHLVSEVVCCAVLVYDLLLSNLLQFCAIILCFRRTGDLEFDSNHQYSKIRFTMCFLTIPQIRLRLCMERES